MFDLEALAGIVEQHGLPAEPEGSVAGDEARPFEAYIEVQLWADGPVARWL